MSDLSKEERMRRMVEQYHNGDRLLVLIDNTNGRYIYPTRNDEYLGEQIITVEEGRVLLSTITDPKHYHNSKTWLDMIEESTQ